MVAVQKTENLKESDVIGWPSALASAYFLANQDPSSSAPIPSHGNQLQVMVLLHEFGESSSNIAQLTIAIEVKKVKEILIVSQKVTASK